MRSYKFLLIAGALAVMLLTGAAVAQYDLTMERPFGVGGTITMIDPDAGTITLNGPTSTGEDGILPEPITFMVNDRTRIVKDGHRAHLEDLAVGDACRALLVHTSDGGLLALSIVAKSPAPPLAWVHGKIVEISLPDSVFALAVITNQDATDLVAARVMRFEVDRCTKVFKDGRPASLGDLRVGDLARVGFVPVPTLTADQPIRAAVVDAKSPEPPMKWVSGKIDKIVHEEYLFSLRVITSSNAENAVLVFAVDKNTRFTKDGRPATWHDIKLGDLARVGFSPDPSGVSGEPIRAAVVEAKSSEPPLVWVGGVIEKIDYEEHIFVLRTMNATDVAGALMTFYVDRGTRITKNGRPAHLGELMAGDLARVGFVPQITTAVVGPIRASVVTAKSPPPPMEKFCGRITGINYEDMTINVVPIDIYCFADCSETFTITEQTKIDKFGHHTIKALAPGDHVCVTYNPLLDVYPPYAICVTVIPEKYAGAIVRVDPHAGTVWCQVSPMGPVIGFHVANATRIFRNGRPVPLEALRLHDYAHIQFFHFLEGNVASLIHARGPYIAPD